MNQKRKNSGFTLGKTDADWEVALQSALDDASENGPSNEGRGELEHVICEFWDAIRLRLSSPKPVKVEPLEIHLKQNPVPIKARQRKSSPEKCEFIEKYIDNLLDVGFVVQTEEAE